MKKEYPTYKLSTPFFKSGLLDSNQRPRAPQTCALPTALNPDLCFKTSAKISSLHVKNKFCQCFFCF